MPAQGQYDLDEIRARLQAWLAAELDDASDVRVGEIGAPGTTGFSSETMLFDARWRHDGREHEQRYVLRTRPTEHPVFPDYDLYAQFRCMQIVGAVSSVPVPKVRWWEPDESVLGQPFYVMEHVDGEVPSDNPPYTVAGFLADASPQQQRALYTAEIGLLERLHAIDWKTAGFDFLDRPQFGRTGFEQQLGYYRHFLAWAAQGRPQPTVEAGLDYLERHCPAGRDIVVLNWGDARPSNIIVRDFQPVAVLDWEMATLGPPEVDVAWFLYLNRFLSEGVGAPPLPGFLGEVETAELYASLSGRRLHDLHYYQVWAGVRFSIIFIRIIQRMDKQGVLVPGWTEQNNICTQFLARVGGFPQPR
ncbi:MAG TPA: phosphotransferase family protein [Candidatus Limnocylindrales bacterium]|nr:phosphotransferase family protein [Candidatus Limnocylindrales bacterium]